MKSIGLVGGGGELRFLMFNAQLPAEVDQFLIFNTQIDRSYIYRQSFHAVIFLFYQSKTSHETKRIILTQSTQVVHVYIHNNCTHILNGCPSILLICTIAHKARRCWHSRSMMTKHNIRASKTLLRKELFQTSKVVFNSNIS